MYFLCLLFIVTRFLIPRFSFLVSFCCFFLLLFSCSSNNEAELKLQLEIAERQNQELKLEKELALVKEKNQQLIKEAEAEAAGKKEDAFFVPFYPPHHNLGSLNPPGPQNMKTPPGLRVSHTLGTLLQENLRLR